MKNFFIVLLSLGLLSLSAPLSYGQTTLEGVSLQEQLNREGQALFLNGAGVRTKLFFDLYVGGLYLSQASQDANRIMKAEAPSLVQLHVISSLITSDKMISATREGFEKSTRGNPAPIQAEIEQFLDMFGAEIKKGDVFEILYLPKTGTQVYKNNTLLGSIPGLQFKRYLMGVWLGADPVDADLKKGLLGG